MFFVSLSKFSLVSSSLGSSKSCCEFGRLLLDVALSLRLNVLINLRKGSVLNSQSFVVIPLNAPKSLKSCSCIRKGTGNEQSNPRGMVGSSIVLSSVTHFKSHDVYRIESFDLLMHLFK
jgi:hypothetical protein